MNYKEFMLKNGVTRKDYLEKWLALDLIPGVLNKDSLELAQFPDSARRPYTNRWLNAKSDVDKIRAHVVKAALTKQHISHKQCFMSPLEFEYMIHELVLANLIVIRVENGITYYDSTLKTRAFIGKPLRELRSFIVDSIASVSEGAITAYLKVS